MKALDRVLTTFGILLLVSFRADAHYVYCCTTNGSTSRR